jgi:predicted Zn finger-like uncharacterized protein
MKFLCPSCKAKYQIADEKVAGRSVRMKCRKCAFMIHVTSPGASSEPPPSSAKQAAENDASPAASDAPPPSSAPARGADVKAMAAPAPPPRMAKKPQPVPSKPETRVAPVPAAPARVTPEPSQPKRPAVAAASAPQRAAVPAPRPVPVKTSSPAHAQAVAEQALPQDLDDEDEDEATRIADSGALAGAFSLAFKQGAAAEPSASTELSMPADEWFVGINGVPVGPIRLSELRSKAGSGSVTKDSLVWRDGFEDWRPLRTFPELLAIVEESVSSVRASMTPFTPPASNVTISDPFAASNAAAVQSGSASLSGSAVATDDLEAVGITKRRTPAAAWIALVIALLFGLTIGFVAFSGQKEVETIVKYVEVPARGAEKNSAAPGGEGVQNAVEETAVETDPKTGVKRASGTKVAASAPEAKSGGLSGLKGLSGLSNLGPSGGPSPGGPSGSTGGGQLDSAQVQSTVSRYTGSVKRSCWQPALDTRDKDAPTSARVVVTMTVGPSGSVQNATTSGDPRGYRGLANCIAARVRGWQFPPSGGTTTVNVPFVFAAQ